MKKFLFLVLLAFLSFSCTKADRLSFSKNLESGTDGLTRKVTATSSFTGEVVYEKIFKNSWFETNENARWVNILDLKKKTKTTLIGDGVLIIIDEITED